MGRGPVFPLLETRKIGFPFDQVKKAKKNGTTRNQ